jgi:hypothetical protein
MMPLPYFEILTNAKLVLVLEKKFQSPDNFFGRKFICIKFFVGREIEFTRFLFGLGEKL